MIESIIIFRLISVLAIVIFAGSVMFNHYAEATNYQETGFRLINNPVICMSTPTDPTLTTKMFGYTTSDIQEWSTLLNAGSTSRNLLWNIQLMPTTSSNICNITIDFIPKPTPDLQLNGEPVGVTILNFNNHKATIHIFYDYVFVNDNGSFDYTDSLAPDYQMEWAIKHELGHAFGLGHYIVSENEIANWLETANVLPSIMFPIIADPRVDYDHGIFQSTITAEDIEQLKLLYNNKGFGGQASQQTISNVPSIPMISIPTTDMAPSDIDYWKKTAIDYFANSTNNMASTDYAVNVLDLVDVFNSEHLVSIPDPIGNQTNMGFWAHMPPWFANNLSWWAEDKISSNDLAQVMQYLYNNGLFYFRTVS